MATVAAASLSTGLPAAAAPMDSLSSTQTSRSVGGVDQSWEFGAASVGVTPVQKGPSAVAVNEETNTIYVANGNNMNGANAGGNTVSVIDGRRCRATDVSGCSGPWPTVTVGNLPSSIAVDQPTNTVYVTNSGDNTVSAFNGATCNSRVRSGCAQAPATMPVGPAPFGVYADAVHHTLYVGNPGPDFDQNTISMIDMSTCNGTDLAGCAEHVPATASVGPGPAAFDLNDQTHTAYVAQDNGVGVFDTDTCNATVQSGCGTVGTLSAGPAFVSVAKVDPATNTVYTANFDNTVSVLDGNTCRAGDLTGCATQVPGTITVSPPQPFENTLWVAVDAARRTLYVANQKDDTLSVVDMRVCNGQNKVACADLDPPTIHTGSDPEGFAVNSTTHTLYIANEVDNTVSVIAADRCNADTAVGCRPRPPAVAVSQPHGIAVDPTVHTAYVTSGDATVAMIDTRSCNAHRPAGCASVPLTATVGAGPADVAVDRSRGTVYVANAGDGTVTMINPRTCNSRRADGCTALPALHVPTGAPVHLSLDQPAHTLYVAVVEPAGSDAVAVFDTATCNAREIGGCQQTPAMVSVGLAGPHGYSSLDLAANPRTHTLYVTNYYDPGYPGYLGNSVFMIDTSACDALDHSGCAQDPTAIHVGISSTGQIADANPSGIAVDPRTETVYTADLFDGEYPGMVSIINGAMCNGTDSSSCGQTPGTAPAGFGSKGMGIDSQSGTVFVSNIEDTSLTVLDIRTCNATRSTGCAAEKKLNVGRAPLDVAVDHAHDTIYVTNGDNTVTVTPIKR